MAFESEVGHPRGFVLTMTLLRQLCHALLIALLLPLTAVAHQSGNSYVRISSTDTGLSVQIDFV